MNPLKMSQYGAILTGRDFGKQVMAELAKGPLPSALDFADVISMGSSFGDEVIPAIAMAQKGEVMILNANKAILSCLAQISDEHKIVLKVTPI